SALELCKLHLVVIEDGTDDAAARIVRQHPDTRVQLLQRVAPNARQSKGEALNAAFNWLRQGALGEHFDPDTAIVCVVDADGRLEADVLDIVLPRFNIPDIGGVQIGVRINNRRANLLARM